MRPLVYCNNAASTWPKPPVVLKAVDDSLSFPYFEAGRSTIEGLHDYPAVTRETLADFFHFDSPDHVVFTQNATDSLNILIHGFAARQPDRFHVITSDLEHNSVLRPLASLESRGKIRLTVIASEDRYVTPASFENAVTSDTRLAVISHGSNVLGTCQPIGEIGAVLRDHGVFCIVDGAQTAGLAEVDFGRLPVDAYAFTGHKYLFGFPGIGGFLIRDPSPIDTFRQGGTGADSANLSHPADLPDKFEAGTHNYPGIVSLCAGTRFVGEMGISRVMNRCQELTRALIRGVSDAENLTIDNPDPDLPVISLSIGSLDCEDAGYILLKKYRIIVRTGLHCAPLIHQKINGGSGSLRISLSCLNTLDECRYVARAVSEVASYADP